MASGEFVTKGTERAIRSQPLYRVVPDPSVLVGKEGLKASLGPIPVVPVTTRGHGRELHGPPSRRLTECPEFRLGFLVLPSGVLVQTLVSDPKRYWAIALSLARLCSVSQTHAR